MRVGERTTVTYQRLLCLCGKTPSVLGGAPSTDAQQLSRGASNMPYKVELFKSHQSITKNTERF